MEKNYINNNKIEIIAEIANSHEGNPQKAYDLALACWKAGADAIKFQIYFADELLSFNHKRFKHFNDQSFSEKIWSKLLNKLKKKKIKIYCDIFGEKAFEIASTNNVDGFKIHSSDLNNLLILEKFKRKEKKYFLSTGGSTLEEINYAIDILNKKKINPVLLHGFQSYPTNILDCNLNRLKTFKKIFNNRCEIGYQDHTSGDDPMNFIIPQIAIGYGVKYIEKHVTLSRSEKGVDYYSSLEPNELKKFISIVNKSQSSIGIGDVKFESNELIYRKAVKKIWHAKSNIKKFQKITKKNVIMKRPSNNAICPVPIEMFLGKKILFNVKRDAPLSRSLFKNNIIATIIVRSKSKRLPKKALLKICNKYSIQHLIDRVKQSKLINRIILCTSSNKEDKIFKEIAKNNNIDFFAGSNLDVLNRMLCALKNKNVNTVIRITGDDILIDPIYMDKTITYHLDNNLDYTENKCLPSGMEVEIFDINTLKKIYSLAEDTNGSEYLTFYIDRYKDQFNAGSFKIKKPISKNIKLTLDTRKDFAIIKLFLEKMSKENKLVSYDLNDVLNFYKENQRKFENNKKKKIKGYDVNTKLNWKKII